MPDEDSDCLTNAPLQLELHEHRYFKYKRLKGFITYLTPH